MGSCCSNGEDRPGAKIVGAHELSPDHVEYFEKSVAKTQKKSDAVKKLWEEAKVLRSGCGSGGTMATARFWFEFNQMVLQRLSELRQEQNGKSAAKNPKIAHTTFLRETNKALQKPIIKIWEQYAIDDVINKESSLLFFDDLIRGSPEMTMPAVQEYARYLLQYYAQQDEGIEKMRVDFVAKATRRLSNHGHDSGYHTGDEDEKPVESCRSPEESLRSPGAVKENVAALQRAKAVDAAQQRTKAAAETDREAAQLSARAKAALAETKAAEGEAAKLTAMFQAEREWIIAVSLEVDLIVKDCTDHYNKNSFTQWHVAFDRFFDGKNVHGDAYDLPLEHLTKVLSVGSGADVSFDSLIQGLGFMVTEADALQEVTRRLQELKDGCSSSSSSSSSEDEGGGVDLALAEGAGVGVGLLLGDDEGEDEAEVDDSSTGSSDMD